MAKYRFDEIARECRSTFKGDKTGMPIVGLEHIVPNEMLVKNFEVNTKNTFTKTFKKGQILFGRRRAYQQKAGVATFDGICSGDITVIEAIPEKIEPELLPFIVQNEYFFEHAVKGSAGSLSPRVKWEHLASYEIELPSLEQQRILANKLWVAYRLKESYKKLLAATEEMVKSQFIEMFGNNKWKVTNLDKLCHEWIKGQAFKKDSMSNDGCNKCIHYGELFTKYGPIINEVYSSTDSTIVKASKRGDILFPASDVTPDGLARCSAIMEDNVLLGGDIIALRPNSNISPQYLSWAINMQKEQLLQRVTGSVVRHISTKGLKTVEVVMPTMTQQKQFVAIAEQADKSKFVGFKSQFIEMFGNPVTNDKKWETQPIQEIAPEKPSNDLQEGDVWLLNLDMIEPNTGRVIEKVYVDSKELLSVSPFDEGNVLFSKLRPYLNKVVIPNGKGYATTELLPLRPKGKKLNKTFFSYLLRSDEFVTYANSIATGTKMPRMPLTSLRKFECILPPMEQQQQFVAIAEQADKSKYNEYKS